MEVLFFEEQVDGPLTMEIAWKIGQLKVVGTVLSDGRGVVILTTTGDSHHKVLEYVLRHSLQVVCDSNAGGGFIRINPDGKVQIYGESASLGWKPLPDDLVQPTIEYVRRNSPH